MDALSQQILREVQALPARKKAAVLELLRAEQTPVHLASRAEEGRDRAAWKASLRDFSAWTAEEIEPVEEARAWLNRWQPKSW